jgi:hypothetical protein
MHQALINDNRVRPVVWLLASAAAQVIAFWYPSYVAQKYPYTDGDSRYFLLPSLIFAGGLVAAASAFLIVRRLGGHSRLSSAGVVALSALASAIAIAPVGIVFVRMFSR